MRLLQFAVFLFAALSGLAAGAVDQQAVNSEQRLDGGRTRSVQLLTDTDLFWQQLDFQNRQSNKEIALLENQAAWRKRGLVALVGGQARLSAMVGSTNTPNKFSYLGRFPADFVGDTATDARMVQANAALAVHADSWINLYGELLFSDVFTFGDFKQGSLQTRQAYAVFGDLSETPWYAFLGKKNISFGDMGTLSPFTQSVVWHYFAPLGEGIGVGYAGEAVELTFMGINGGRQIRLADSEEKGKLNNLAANTLLTLIEDEGLLFRVGGGYLLGTIYDGTFPEHLDPDLFGEYNPAWDVNALLRVGPMLFAAEYVTTLDDWPSTGHAVTAYRAEGGIDLACFDFPSRLSVSWSEGLQGDRGTEFEFNRQLVIGWGATLGRHALLSLEYIRSSGFAPLINITTVSDRDVVQDTALAGMTLVF